MFATVLSTYALRACAVRVHSCVSHEADACRICSCGYRGGCARDDVDWCRCIDDAVGVDLALTVLVSSCEPRAQLFSIFTLKYLNQLVLYCVLKIDKILKIR